MGKNPPVSLLLTRRSQRVSTGYEAVEPDRLQLAHRRKLHKDECYPQGVAVYRSTSLQSHYDPTSDIYILAPCTINLGTDSS